MMILNYAILLFNRQLKYILTRLDRFTQTKQQTSNLMTEINSPQNLKSMNSSAVTASSFASRARSFLDQEDDTSHQWILNSTTKSQQLYQANEEQDIRFEEQCLLKLKHQRQKMEDLSKLYQLNKQQLKREVQKVHKLSAVLQDFNQMKQYKKKWEQITLQNHSIITSNQIYEQKIQNLKVELSETLKQNQYLKKLLVHEKKQLQNQNYQNVSQFEQLIKERQDQLRKQASYFQEKQAQFQRQQIKLQDAIKEFKGQLQMMKKSSQTQETQYAKDLARKDLQNKKMKQILDNMKQETKILRDQLHQLDQECIRRQKQWEDTCDKLAHQIRQLKRQNSNKSQMIQSLNTKMEKASMNIKQIDRQKFLLNETMIKKEQEASSIINSLVNEFSIKKQNFQNHIEELTQSIRELIDVKNKLMKENSKLKEQFQKKDLQRKKRRLLIRSEMRQLERLEEAIKKSE